MNELKNTDQRYFSYQRVSSERQTEGMSLEEQTRQIKLFAERKEKDLKVKFTIVRDFIEVDSASELNRPVFAEMLEELKRQKATGIIFNSVDRSARNPFDQAKLFKLIQEGYTFHFTAENLSTDNPMARSMLLIMWGMASSFTENLKFHINKGIMGMLGDGRSPNAAPVGYLDKGKGVKEIDPLQSRLIKEMFELYATGEYDVINLTKKMHQRGLKNKEGNPIHFKAVYKLLRKTFYYGIITYRGEQYQGQHKSIITKSLFDKVQDVLDGKSLKNKRIYTYIFQALIHCPVCKKTLRSISAKRRYKYYNCRDRKCSYRNTVSEPEIEAKFLDQLRKLQFTDKEITMFLKAIVQFREELRLTNKEQIRQLEMEETRIDQYQEDLLTKYLEKKVTDDEFRLMKSKYLNQRQATDERRTALSKADEDICNHIEKIGKLLHKPVDVYFKADDDNKRRLVKSMIDEIQMENENVTIYWKKEFNIVAERTKNTTESGDVLCGSATGNRTPI